MCGIKENLLRLIISGSYGSLAKFRNISRLKTVGDHCVVGAGGDIADFHALSHMLDALLCVLFLCILSCLIELFPSFF